MVPCGGVRVNRKCKFACKSTRTVAFNCARLCRNFLRRAMPRRKHLLPKPRSSPCEGPLESSHRRDRRVWRGEGRGSARASDLARRSCHLSVHGARGLGLWRVGRLRAKGHADVEHAQPLGMTHERVAVRPTLPQGLLGHHGAVRLGDRRHGGFPRRLLLLLRAPLNLRVQKRQLKLDLLDRRQKVVLNRHGPLLGVLLGKNV